MSVFGRLKAESKALPKRTWAIFLTGLMVLAYAKITDADIGGSARRGVQSLNGLRGAVTLSAGTNITLTPTGNDIEIASSGGGSAVVLDLADDASNESVDLSEIATTGDTNSIFTEPTADKLLITVSNDWPKADDADDVTCVGCVADGELATDFISETELDTEGELETQLTDVANVYTDNDVIPVADGGTNLTASADDNVMVGNATTWESKALTDCDGATDAVTYDVTTNTWGCNTIAAGASEWTDLGTVLHPTETGDDVVIGNTAIIGGAKFSVDGDADQVQTIIQGNATQTGDIFIVEESDGTDIFSIDTANTTLSSVSTVTFANVTSIGVADGALLDLSAVNASSNTEGLQLPQATSTASQTAEGLLAWDTDQDLLYAGNATTNELVNQTLTDDNIMVGDGTQPATTAIPDCDDSAGQHLNYDTATNSFSCGTTASSGMIREGSNVTEGTTTSTTAVDIVTVSSLNIGINKPILIVAKLRKTGGDASAAQVGVKLTQAAGTCQILSNSAWSSATNQAEGGFLMAVVGPRRGGLANIGTGLGFTSSNNGATSQLRHTDANFFNSTEAITQVDITGLVGNAAVTMGVDEVHVYSLSDS